MMRRVVLSCLGMAIALTGAVAVLLAFPEPLYAWRVHADSLSGTTPWYVLARNDVPIRRRLGLLAAEQVGHELAAIDMARAFEKAFGRRSGHFCNTKGFYIKISDGEVKISDGEVS